MVDFSRRAFMISAAGSAVAGSTLARAATASSDTPWANEKIVDCHFHERASAESMIAHMDGAGVTGALVLAFSEFGERMPALRSAHPGRFLGWGRGAKLTDAPLPLPSMVQPPAAYDMTKPFETGRSSPNFITLTHEKTSGWKGFGETVGVVEVDGPELQRLYSLAAELDVPVMMHFQEGVVPGQPRYGVRGFSRIEAMLRRFPKTRFVCHSSDFWGNIDASYTDGGRYPTGKVNRGGLSDQLLADYPNMYGDLGAPSALMQLSRDPDFTADFLRRHQHKLMFGSDCGCSDGRGGSGFPANGAATGAGASSSATSDTDAAARSMQQRLTAQGGNAGKCIARELLRITWQSTPREAFRRLVWRNALRVYKLDA